MTMPVIDAQNKAWQRLLARASRTGFQLWRSDDPADGQVHYFAGRRGLVRMFCDLSEVEALLDLFAGA